MRLIAREALVSSERLDRVLERFSRGHLPLVIQTLAEGIATGEIDGELPLPVAMMCTVGLAVAPQVIRRVGGQRIPLLAALPEGEAFADLIVSLLFRAIGPRRQA